MAPSNVASLTYPGAWSVTGWTRADDVWSRLAAGWRIIGSQRKAATSPAPSGSGGSRVASPRSGIPPGRQERRRRPCAGSAGGPRRARASPSGGAPAGTRWRRRRGRRSPGRTASSLDRPPPSPGDVREIRRPVAGARRPVAATTRRKRSVSPGSGASPAARWRQQPEQRRERSSNLVQLHARRWPLAVGAASCRRRRGSPRWRSQAIAPACASGRPPGSATSSR